MNVKRILIEGGTRTEGLSVSAVVPTIKERVVTLQSLEKASRRLLLDLEVIVVRDSGPRLEHRATRGRMRNIGAHMARGDILVFVDDDIVFQPSDLKRAIDLLLSARGIVTGGVYIEPWGCLPTIGTRFLALKKIDFWHIGGFNEKLCAYEDWEFTTRALLKGFRLASCAPGVKHTHKRNFQELLFRNLIREIHGTRAMVMYVKYLRGRTLRWFFPLFIRDPALANDLWRNGLTRAALRILAFYYLTLKRISKTVGSCFLRFLEPA